MRRYVLRERFFRHLRAGFAAFRPTVIHAHESFEVGPAAHAAARAVNSPLVFELRGLTEESDRVNHPGPRSELKAMLDRGAKLRVARSSARVVALCAGIRSWLEEHGVPPERIDVIGNAVHIEDWSGIPRSPDTGVPTLGYISSLRPLEGLGFLIQALQPMLLDRRVRLLIVGGGPQRPMLEAQARLLGVAARVEFTGEIPHRHVRTQYRRIDVFVVPRIRCTACERVTPLKPLEAMADGIPVLASAVGGMCEYVRDGVNGLLFEPGDGEGLRAGVQRLLAEPGLGKRLATTALEWVRGERDARTVYAGYRSIYERIVHAH